MEKEILAELINNYVIHASIDNLIEKICMSGKHSTRFCSQYVSGKMRYWFEYRQGNGEVTLGSEETKAGAVLALISQRN